MTTLKITTRAGDQVSLDADPAIPIMQNIRDHSGIDEIEALCGGCATCGTCHVLLAPESFALFPAMAEDEDGLLDTLEHRGETSRLSCQLRVTGSMPDISLTIAPAG